MKKTTRLIFAAAALCVANLASADFLLRVQGGQGAAPSDGGGGSGMFGSVDVGAMASGTFTQITGMTNWANGQFMMPLGLPNCVVGDNISQFANKAAWDPVHVEWRFEGSPHGSCSQYKFVIYSPVTNTWSSGPQSQSGDDLKHAYDHNTIDPATGDHYMREYDSSVVHKWVHGAGSWTALPTISMSSRQCCGALEWMANTGRLIFIDGGWGGWSYNPGTNMWTHLFDTSAPDFGPPTYTMIAHDNFAEYSAVRGLLIFGGGSNVYKMDSSGTVTALTAAPFDDLHAGGAVPCCSITTNPVNGNLLVINEDNEMWELDPTSSGTWTEKTGVTVPSFFENGGAEVISAPIGEPYNVVMYTKLTTSGSEGRAYVFKP